MTDYAAYLQQHGLKATFQRIKILENVEHYGHMSIDEIYEEVAKTYPSLSLATVYKNIILMVDNNLLTEVPMSGKKSKYELIKEDHIHLVCTQCGDVVDKPHMLETDSLLSTLSADEHFSLEKQQINLYGVCQICQIKKVS